jgi:hypothetical protein
MNNKGKYNPNYRHGECCKKHLCKTCGKEIYYISTLCRECSNKSRTGIKRPQQSRLMTNRKHSALTLKKISKAQKGKKNSMYKRVGVTGNKDVIHHINLNTKNNKKSNLLKMKQVTHLFLHNNSYRYLVHLGLERKYIKWFFKNYTLLTGRSINE